jgi:hypothetical protein
MKARFAAAVLLAALLVPSASAQFIYVANAGEDTVSKIDINPPYNEVARYATWFTSGTNYVAHLGNPYAGPAPSRIAQDSTGNVYVLDRFFTAHLPVLLKIAPANGPVLPILESGTANNKIDPGELTDARIKWASEIGIASQDQGHLGRALGIDTSGVLWIGIYGQVTNVPFSGAVAPGTAKYYKVAPATGMVIGTPITIPTVAGYVHSPYGCQVDTNGKLWSVDEHDSLAEIDTFTNQVKIHNHGPNPGPPPTDFGSNYSVSLFNGCGSPPNIKVYLSERRKGKTYIVYDPQTSSFSNSPTTIPQFSSVAVAVDSQGNIVSGEQSGTGRVIKTTPGGNVLWDQTPTPSSGRQIPDLHGIIIDANDDVWAVDLWGNRVIKYSGANGQWIATVPVGDSPYTYGNPPPPTCPCAVTSEPQIKCKKKNNKGEWEYSWSFVVTNQSPFSMPATTIDILAPTGSPITGLTPQQFTFPSPGLPPKGQATVTGTFTLAQPVPGTEICFDIRLNAGTGWCCPLEHVCFIVPDCACASLQGVFKCSHGHPYLELSVTNLGPTAAAGAQIFSNTPGVTVSPPTTTQSFPQNTPVIVPLTVTGATPGQVISLSVMLHGPIDPKTGVNSWCCTVTVKVTYPAKLCWWWPDGDIFDDINANGLRDSGEGGLPDWTVTLTDAKGTPRTTKSDASGKYNFEEVEPGKYRLSVQPPKGWRATTPKGGANALSVEAPPKENLDFGFVKTR